MYNAAIHSGLTLGPLLGILLFPAGIGNLPFALFAALCFAGGAVVLLFLPRLPAASRPAAVRAPSPRELLRLVTARGSGVVLSGVVLYGAGYGIFISVLPATLALTKGFDALATGIFFALFYAAISVSQVVVGPLSDRHGRRVYMVAGFVLAALGFGSFAVLSHPWIYGPLTLASFGLGVFCVSSLAFLYESAPESLRASLSGSYYLAWGLGYFLGPIVVGWLAETLNPQAGYWILASMNAAHAALNRRTVTAEIGSSARGSAGWRGRRRRRSARRP